MNQSTVLIISILIISSLIAGVAFILYNKPHSKHLTLFSSHRMLNHKDIMAYVNAMNIKLNNPKNLLYPEILTQLPLDKLAQVSVSTMQDTSVLVETILSKISLSTVNQLKSLKPEVIMAMNPFQLQYLDESLIGQGDYAPLLALVPGTLTQDQANAFLFKVNPPPANVNQTLSK